ncbi:phosphoribosylformylglycinamidine synthase [Acidaminobacter hydrogenoformans]|uniref:Phosphoribosylformylglycinamidine synthase n=1 Tax=Acidaminobacter hydrogenoformans DSM 2784 TaxID=1120920 RepID=A0A1G5RZ14_9FIRM|nr:phosphoribosylformylglycinamidine synthase [Acidaminobacter hydrogenoformans]SCZ78691.1 phosphoribosylformylglycinamidine synthase [Acidaminobacter hydrogenoformans DSM 2784]
MQGVRKFVRKIEALDVESAGLTSQIRDFLKIGAVTKAEVYNGYDIFGLEASEVAQAVQHVFAEPNVDLVSDVWTPVQGETAFAYRLLPGQYDQRSDSAVQLLTILKLGKDPHVVSFKAVRLTSERALTAEEVEGIKRFLINPVEAMEISLYELCPAEVVQPEAPPVEVLHGFRELSEEALEGFLAGHGLAMSREDLTMVQDYFKTTAGRDPKMTELKVLDTYWSDHCRHTTFMTELKDIDFSEATYGPLREAYEKYGQKRADIATSKPETLMDLATIQARWLRKQGGLADVEVSDEINAATFMVDAAFENGETKPYLVMFKNETHNHPTEIEPFGGAATCLGGAIRDPLSGRSYVYQGMRITGSGDPTESLEKTLPGKLPQRVITRGAAKGFSSYGNQIGLPAGYIREYYNEGFKAKRMEVGAVIGAAPAENVKRLKPKLGDRVLLIGGKTGIDGIGGATGSSKEHDESSLATCASEVQRGNAPEERKLQRLFRRPEFAKRIKKSNDFGAGGVSVAVGELADSLDIQLDAIKTKYPGLGAIELAISESQERMAVVVDRCDVERVIALAASENLDAYEIAQVTDSGKLRMFLKGEVVLELGREFIDSSGASRSQVVKVTEVPVAGSGADAGAAVEAAQAEAVLTATVSDLNSASQIGLIENFDNTVGAYSILMPFGGVRQMSPSMSMVAKLPSAEGTSLTGTVMSAGYALKALEQDPFVGGAMSVAEAVAKAVLTGANLERIHLSCQEYFERLGTDPLKWQKPFKALLGALHAMDAFGLGAIGGKDSMSGTFKDLNVPPTLIAFAAAPVDLKNVVSTDFKAEGSTVYLADVARDAAGLPDLTAYAARLKEAQTLIGHGAVLSSYVVEEGGVLESLFKMGVGNGIGVKLSGDVIPAAGFGALMLEIDIASTDAVPADWVMLGETQRAYSIDAQGAGVDLKKVEEAWLEPLDSVFPRCRPYADAPLAAKEPSVDKKKEKRDVVFGEGRPSANILRGVKPRVFIPAFPGTNCEIDTARAFERAGAEAEVIVFRNRSLADVELSIEAYEMAISRAQMIALPGGFSAGDEPDGSGKFISSVFKNARISEATMKLLKQRDGLMIGICNGFQALIKLGLLPYGEIRDLGPEDPTLTYNACCKHISKMVQIEVVSKMSPWLARASEGVRYSVPVSHGEGRFFASEAQYEALLAAGQVATVYSRGHNLNGSAFGVEGLVSPDGRVLGKMGHAERMTSHTYLNVPGQYDMEIFEAGVDYFNK